MEDILDPGNRDFSPVIIDGVSLHYVQYLHIFLVDVREFVFFQRVSIHNNELCLIEN